MTPFRFAHFSPGKLLLLAIGLLIALGTALLALPISRTTSISFIDLLFTATSATCVTGLFTIPLSDFTFFGHCILLGLIQIGGLGIVTLTFFFMSVFLKMGLGIQLAAGELLELQTWKDAKKVLVFIVSITVFFEALGALFLFWRFASYYNHDKALFYGIFHAISSFCNAGITLFPTNLAQFSTDYPLLSCCMLLMFIGGLGFIPLFELIVHMQRRLKNKRHHVSLHTQIILYSTSISIIISTILIWLLEKNHAFASLSFIGSIITSLFSALSFRSTGLTTIPLSACTLATIFLMMLISFIGSSPGSTGSGVKISTLALYIGIVRAAITNQHEVNIRSRRIAKDQINKAIAIMSLSLLWIALSICALLILEPNQKFIAIAVEAVSALSNLGLSTHTTASLSIGSKIIVIMSMIIGRIGSLTLILALRKIAHWSKPGTSEFKYPEERIMLS